MYNISVEQLTDIQLARRACSFTTGGKPSSISYEQLAMCEHSPLRTILFWIEMEDIPTFVSVHFVRHWVWAQHYVKSNREDRGGDSVVNRHTPVHHAILCNAQSLINMARKRLCMQASKETRDVMQDIKFCSPEWIGPYLIPECEYRGGICHELKPCGRYPSECRTT